MKFMIKSLGFNWKDNKIYNKVLNESKITNVHKSNYTNHVNRMPRKILTNIIQFCTKKAE